MTGARGLKDRAGRRAVMCTARRAEDRNPGREVHDAENRAEMAVTAPAARLAEPA